jgi:hypothetical protein
MTVITDDVDEAGTVAEGSRDDERRLNSLSSGTEDAMADLFDRSKCSAHHSRSGFSVRRCSHPSWMSRTTENIPRLKCYISWGQTSLTAYSLPSLNPQAFNLQSHCALSLPNYTGSIHNTDRPTHPPINQLNHFDVTEDLLQRNAFCLLRRETVFVGCNRPDSARCSVRTEQKASPAYSTATVTESADCLQDAPSTFHSFFRHGTFCGPPPHICLSDPLPPTLPRDQNLPSPAVATWSMETSPCVRPSIWLLRLPSPRSPRSG